MELSMHISTDGNRTANLLYIYSSVKFSFPFSHSVRTWFSFSCSHASAAPLFSPLHCVHWPHFFKDKKLLYYSMWMCILSACMHVHHVYVPAEGRRGYQILWHWGCRWLEAIWCGCWESNSGPLWKRYLLKCWAANFSYLFIGLFILDLYTLLPLFR